MTIFLDLTAIIHRHRDRLPGLLLISLVFITFWPVLGHPFIDFDDPLYILDNSHLASGFNHDNLIWILTTSHEGYWHPLTFLTYLLDYRLFGLNAVGYYFVNLIFHTGTVLTLFLFLRLVTGRIVLSFLIAAIFAIHPLRVESVAWIAERKDVLCGFFWMLTLLSYLHYCKKPYRLRYFLVVLLFIMALLAKPMAVTLPCALLLLDFWPFNRIRWPKTDRFHAPLSLIAPEFEYPEITLKQAIMEKIPLLLFSAITSLIIVLPIKDTHLVVPLSRISLPVRIVNAFVAYGTYLRKIFLPYDLSVIYPHYGNHLSFIKNIPFIVLVLLLSVLAIKLIHRKPYLFTGWFWFLGVLFPTIGLIQTGGQSMADRYTYLPSIGILIVIVFFVFEQCNRFKFKKSMRLIGTLGILLPLVLLTRNQLSYWASSEKLFQHALALDEKNPIAHFGLGSAYLKQNKNNAAKKHLLRALALSGNFSGAMHNLGVILKSEGKYEEALAYFRQSLPNATDYFSAYWNMGDICLKRGNKKAAKLYFEKALSIKPASEVVLTSLAGILIQLNQPAKARPYLDKALKIKPDYIFATFQLGKIELMQGKKETAFELWSSVIQKKPRFVDAYIEIAQLFEATDNLQEALFYNISGLHVSPGHPTINAGIRRITEKMCLDPQKAKTD